MRVGFFRRLTAFLVDTMPIILTLSLLLSLFVGDLLKSEYPDYEEDFAIYQENLDIYYNSLSYLGKQRDIEKITPEEYATSLVDLLVQLDNETITAKEFILTSKDLKEQRDINTITSEEYTTLSTDLREDFNTVNADYSSMILAYYLNVVLYFFISYSIINYFYNLILKGQTFGRRFMKIELYGKITWFTLLLREFLWKPVFWLFTFSAGIAIDIGLILFTKKKKTIRDYLSDTELRFTGISYPF